MRSNQFIVLSLQLFFSGELCGTMQKLLNGCFLNVSMEIAIDVTKEQICLICILDLLAEIINLPDSRDILNIFISGLKLHKKSGKLVPAQQERRSYG